jgi:hypothetical protein
MTAVRHGHTTGLEIMPVQASFRDARRVGHDPRAEAHGFMASLCEAEPLEPWQPKSDKHPSPGELIDSVALSLFFIQQTH